MELRPVVLISYFLSVDYLVVRVTRINLGLAITTANRITLPEKFAVAPTADGTFITKS
jgi:hypothetical protein